MSQGYTFNKPPSCCPKCRTSGAWHRFCNNCNQIPLPKLHEKRGERGTGH